MTVLTLGLWLGLTGCGAKTGLAMGGEGEGEGDGGDHADAGANHQPDGGVVGSCQVFWEACTARTAAIQISDGHAQTPDVAWDGRELLVVYDDEDIGNTLVHVDMDGIVTERVELDGVQQPRVTWNPVLGTGLVVVDSGVQWLGSDGWPVGDYAPAAIALSQLSGDVSATAEGFVVLSGTNAYTEPPPLYYAVLGAGPAPVSFQLLAEGGPRAPAVHANGPDGLGRWAASTAYYDDVGELYRIDRAGQPPEWSKALGGLLPNGGNGFVSAIAQRGGALYLLYEGAPNRDVTPWTQWMLEIDPDDGDDERRSWQIDRSPNGGSGDLISFGGALVLASPAIHPEHRVSLAAFEPALAEPVGALWELATSGFTVSHSARMTPTPTGLAVVWTEGREAFDGLVVMLEVLECCPRD